MTPSVRAPTANEPGAAHDAAIRVASDAVSTTPAEIKTDNPISVESVDLKSIVKPMLARELFKLEPTRAQAYFANIAALQPQPSDESWEQTYRGTSKQPWLDSVLIELAEVDGRWGLGQSQITWRPPKAQARALYDRLVAEVQRARGRKPDFGEDESEGGKQQRFAGWSWCKDACQAIVALDSNGRMSIDSPSQIDQNRPAVLLKVFTPEGP
ncbi:MAG TPA: hypothetical protein VFN67_07855 [Polyangiales bacterium]|nr:hypothetical protein [Polyangiales bacterium]